jgi:hypothetical protein
LPGNDRDVTIVGLAYSLIAVGELKNGWIGIVVLVLLLFLRLLMIMRRRQK